MSNETDITREMVYNYPTIPLVSLCMQSESCELCVSNISIRIKTPAVGNQNYSFGILVKGFIYKFRLIIISTITFDLLILGVIVTKKEINKIYNYQVWSTVKVNVCRKPLIDIQIDLQY